MLRDRGAVQGLERVTLDELVAETLPEARCQYSGLDGIGPCCCRGLVLTSQSIDAIFIPMHIHARTQALVPDEVKAEAIKEIQRFLYSEG